MDNDGMMDIGAIASRMKTPEINANQCSMSILASMRDDVGMTAELKKQSLAVKDARENFLMGMKNKVPMDIRSKHYTELTEKLLALNESIEVLEKRKEPICEEMADELEKTYEEVRESANLLTDPQTMNYLMGQDEKKASEKGPVDPKELVKVVLSKMIEMILAILSFGRYKRNERNFSRDNAPLP